MTKHVSTVTEDIREVLKNVSSGTDHVVSEDALVNLGFNITCKVRDALTARARTPRTNKTLYASEVGKPCIRQVWYGYHTPELAEKLPPSLIVKFLYGDLLEELLLFLAEAAGHTVADHQKVVEIALPNGWKLRGKIDATIDGVVVDTKSASGYGFKKFQTGLTDANDSFGYRAQLAAYTNDEDAGFLVINKENGQIAYSRGNVGEYDIQERLRVLTNALDNEYVIPPKQFDDVADGLSGNRKLCTECSYCPYKRHCWQDANHGTGLRVFAYAGKPAFLTNVAREPKVEEISFVTFSEAAE